MPSLQDAIKSEFTNWRDEQESWRTTAALNHRMSGFPGWSSSGRTRRSRACGTRSSRRGRSTGSRGKAQVREDLESRPGGRPVAPVVVLAAQMLVVDVGDIGGCCGWVGRQLGFLAAGIGGLPRGAGCA
jgi:hypothetical protein